MRPCMQSAIINFTPLLFPLNTISPLFNTRTAHQDVCSYSTQRYQGAYMARCAGSGRCQWQWELIARLHVWHKHTEQRPRLDSS